ncbi:MAG TPA: ribonuclease PH [Caldisericia bacterium]|nr:MAG: Ribonuclease PH [bacterium ADurb.Bin132]HNW31500.1 ribonuclease PH [Caldisericia bacterium]HNY61726.1 ribonuclease PH [Caldisericia bacterium]HOC79756.1 ribonuclease PH [Caldisericia bacterium]HOG70727.1 ribonuclease PH [Caldisericia bacterium]
MRIDSRDNDQLRPVKIEPNYMKYAEGSALVVWGETKVICTASWEPRVPNWLKELGQGWVTAEYSMIPRCSPQRIQRDINKKASRSVEIQRLIGRSLRSVVDLQQLGENSITIDCDVVQADGGTRVASIVGGFVSLVLALRNIGLKKMPIKDYLGAVSLGIIDNELRLDLNYEEDSRAQVDMNFVMDSAQKIAEVQATAEISTFPFDTFNKMLELGRKGINEIIELEKKILGPLQ